LDKLTRRCQTNQGSVVDANDELGMAHCHKQTLPERHLTAKIHAQLAQQMHRIEIYHAERWPVERESVRVVRCAGM